MSRVVPLAPAGRPRVRASAGLALCAAFVAGIVAGPVSAQEPPPCSAERTFDCLLPDWSEAPARDIPSLFGELDPMVWVEDAAGDAPADGLDILGAGVARADITDPGPIRRSDELLKKGKRKQAVPRGPAVLVRVELDRPVDTLDGDHAGIHVVTDADGSRSNNAPTGVADPMGPFAGSQDVYSLTWAATTGATKLLSSDLARRWYKAKEPFAAAWASPTVLDVLIAPPAFGDAFRVVTHVEGDDGGYDSLSLGPGAIPADGEVGLVPLCVEGSVAQLPYVVSRLVENGQTLRDVKAPASWQGGASIPLDEAARTTLSSFIASNDEDGDGRVGLDATVSLFEDGVVIRQRPLLQLGLDREAAYLSLELGLTRRGYNVVRAFELAPTGDEAVDAWLERATRALTAGMPPFRTTKKSGLVAGEGIGSCVPWLEPPPEPQPEAPDEPAPGDETASASA